MRKFLLNLLFMALMVPWITQAQTPTPATLPYTCGFEDDTENAAWTSVNGSGTNKFFIGSATNNGGTKALYISNTNGSTNAYSNSSAGYAYAYREISIATPGSFTFQFDWKAVGESSLDYIRAFLVPSTATDTLIPCASGSTSHTGITTTGLRSGWIAIDGASYKNSSSSWQTFTTAEIPLEAGTYKLVFYWRNDGSVGTNPPAAIDNVVINNISCSKPTNLVVSNILIDGATVSWTEAGTATQWIVEYDTAGFTLGTGISQLLTSDTLVITGLEPNTPYDVYVRAYCGVSDSSTWLKGDFRTKCLPYTEDMLPYTETFEAYSASSSITSTINPCWTRWSTSTSTTTIYPYISSLTSNGVPDKAMYMYGTTSIRSVLALPAFDVELSTLQVEFDLVRTSTSAISPLLVGVMSDPEDLSTFDTLAIVTCSRQSTWERFEIPLVSYTGDGTYIAFATPQGVASYNYIDDITVTTISECATPINVVASNISLNGADISWTDPLGSAWIVEYGPAGFQKGTGYMENVSSANFTLTTLLPSTGYDVYVRTECTDDTSAYSAVCSFRTPCDAYMSVPFFDNFDSYGFGSNIRPECWTYEGYSTSYPQISASQKYSGVASIYMYCYRSSSTPDATTYLMSPEIDVTTTPIQTLETSFRMLATSFGSSYPNTIVVGVVSDTSDILGSFYPIDTVSSSVASTWEEFEVSFANYPTDSNGRWILFASRPISTSTSGYNYTYIDDLKIDLIPSCARPRTLENIRTTSSSLTVKWTDLDPDHTTWEVAYGLSGFNPDDIVDPETATIVPNISDDTLLVENLVAGTLYDFYVRTDCGGDVSNWRGPISASPGAYNVPITGVDSIRVCGATLYDDGGAGGQYSNNCSGMMIVYPSSQDSLMAVVAGTYSGESCCDYLKIYDGVGTFGTLLFSGMGSATITDTLKSTTGPLTIQFTSDGSGIGTGFQLRLACIEAPACPMILDVEVSNITGRSAYLTWDYSSVAINEPSSFELEVVQDGVVVDVYTTTEPYFLVPSLDPLTEYTVRVKALCDADGSEGLMDSITFETKCLAGGEVELNNGTTTTTYLPTNTLYDYSYTQQLFTSSEFNGATVLNSVTFYQTSTYNMTRDIDIYLAETSQSTLSSATAIPLSNLTLVYSGEYTFVQGANTIVFDSSFAYNGTSNIVLAVDDNTGDYTSTITWRGHSAPSKAIYKYQDNNDLNPSSSISFSSGSTRCDVMFGASCDYTTTCIGPNVVVTNVEPTQVDIVWVPGNTETSWDVAYMATGDTGWTVVATATTATSHSFTNLNDATNYSFRVSTTCGTESADRIVNVLTPCLPYSVPFYEGFESWPTSSTAAIDPCWHKKTNYSTDYPYASTSYSISPNKSMYMYSTSSSYSLLALPKFSTPIDSLQVTFGLLKTNTSYAHEIQVGIMTDPTDLSTFVPVASAIPTVGTYEWEMFEFPLSNYTGEDGYITLMSPDGVYSYPYLDDLEVNLIPTCPRPRNVNVPDETITTTSAVVTWFDTNASSWIVEYGPVGFTRGYGTMDIASSTTYTIVGLNPSSRYDVYVYGLCSATDTSLASFRKTFTTDCAVLSNFPVFEGFTGYATGTSATYHYPVCWYGGSNYSTSYPYFNAVSSDVAEYLYCYVSGAASSGTKYTYIAMPAIDSSQYQITDMMVSFRAKAASTGTTYDQRLYIGVSVDPNDPSTFTAIDTVDLRGHTNWVSVDELDFSNFTGTGKYVTFLVCPEITSGTSAYSSVYIDDIELDLIPTCRRPADVRVNSVSATTIELAWTERNSATSWEIEYGPMGFAQGSGTTVTANTNPYTITGLTANTNYDFYVKSVCSTTDHSRFTRANHFSTAQVPATIPYSYDFESEGEWANWGVNTGYSSVNWFRGTATAAQGTNSMYVSSDNGQTVSTQMATVNTSAYRDLDLGTTDTNFTVSFKAKAGGSPDAAYDGLMIFLVDPSVVVEGPTAAITSPWGNVNNLYRIGTVRMDTVFSEYVVELDTISGIQRLAFFYFNQNTSFIGGPAAVDDINIVVTSCPRPNSFHITNLDATTADFAWNGSASGYYFYYTDGQTLDSIYTTSNTFTLTGLTPNTSYACAVKAVCGNEMSIYSDQISFSTPQILAQLPYFCGFEAEDPETSQWSINNGNATNAWYIDTVARDSGSYGLYISQDGGATHTYDGTASSVAWAYRDFYFPNAAATDTFEINFRWMCNGESSFDYCQIYIGAPAPTTAGAISSITAPSGATLLGQINQNATGFETKRFFLPAERYGGSTQRVYFGWRNDGSVTNQPPMVIDNFTILSPVAGCIPPITTVTPGATTADFAFDVQGTYGISCSVSGSGTWSDEQIAVDATVYTFTGLTPETVYEYRARRICDSTSASNWAQGSFITTELPCVAPMGFAASNIEMTSATVAWTDSLNNQEAWKVTYGYGNDASAWDTIDVTTASVNLSGLYSNTEYTVRVRAYCSVEADVYSEWSEGFTFRTATCEGVSNITASGVSTSGAVITWTPGANQTKWEISYGMEGVSEENGTKVVVENTPTYTIEGLESDLTYDVYVRTVCAEGVTSAWSNKIQFRTNVGINTASTDNVKVQIYPNPANSEATVSVDGINGKVEFVVADMNGRMIVTETINCEGSLVKTIDVSNLAKGAYFVHIYNDNFNTTRKLIVK